MNKPRLLHRVQMFLGFMFGRFFGGRRMANAASLSYASLLAIVPLMVVSLSVLSAFPVFQSVIQEIQDYIFKNFLPDSRGVLQQYLQTFASKASKLTMVGIVSMLVTALLLMSSIDRSLNEIWHVHQRRKRLVGFLVYWALLTLGPLLLGSSMAITSYLVSLPFMNQAAGLGLKQYLLPILPFLMESLAFTLMYWVVPNRSVQVKHAIVGGLLAAFVFELAKKLFAYYITHFPTYEAIYGTLATIPIFLIWMYASWLIILLGAEFTYCLGAFREQLTERIDSGLRFVYVVRILGYLWQAQVEGRQLELAEIRGKVPQVSDQMLHGMLEHLTESRIVHRADSGEWGLSRDLSSLTLSELFRSGGYVLPELQQEWMKDDNWSMVLAPVLATASRDMDEAMGVSLLQLFQSAGPDVTEQALP